MFVFGLVLGVAAGGSAVWFGKEWILAAIAKVKSLLHVG